MQKVPLGEPSRVLFLASTLGVLVAAAMMTARTEAQSRWANLGPDGKLQYAHLKTGDRIPDFSSAGYRGGGVALPMVAAFAKLKPSGSDDTASIQQAIDDVSRLPLHNGSRGAVVLSAGTFHLSKTLLLSSSGVVLRGAGSGGSGTTLQATGDPHLVIRVAGTLVQKPDSQQTTMSDPYVAEGTTTFRVTDAAGIHTGDTVVITKPITPEWVHFMGMDTLGSRNGKPEHWIDGTLSVRRRVASVAGNSITLTVPLMDSYDARYLGMHTVTVTRTELSGQVAEVGVEELRIVAPTQKIKLGSPEFDGLKMTNAVDCWLKNLAFRDTTSSVAIDAGTERISVVSVDVVNTVSIEGAAKPADFETNGQQILFDRCTGSGDNTFYFLTQPKQQGPVVVLHCRFTGNGHIQPHQRWSTGLLIDSCEVPAGGIDLKNRGMMGSGHGWAIGWSVIWNSMARSFEVNQPPGGANWSIGNRGEELNPDQPVFGDGARIPLQPGFVDRLNRPVTPGSLYLAQLAERLGPTALKNIGY